MLNIQPDRISEGTVDRWSSASLLSGEAFLLSSWGPLCNMFEAHVGRNIPSSNIRVD